MKEKGGISVQTEHIFPIIKKWLYSEKEIFLRELVSNASDAIAKLQHLSSIGQASGINKDEFKITVRADKDKKTLTISDNGIGMSEEEIKKYINQIALSGALDFIKQYDNSEEKEADKPVDGIIGHFGLGFYSAFMVADKVEIETKSFTDVPAIHWECSSDGDYEMAEGTKTERGTDIILNLTDDEKEYLQRDKLTDILEKYCSFMPTPIFLEVSDDPKPEENKDLENKEGTEEKDSQEPKAINDSDPLWMKNPSQCTDEEYTNFYRKVFRDYAEPLFHIHINADYPLNFKGILYFPKINHEYQSLEGQVKLYYNRVFVADNIKEIIPDYLLMLKGVLDCPELPLNVSRSYLQTNSYVAKLSAHIVKKVCDKLNGLFNTEREKYESFYDDIKTFIEYGCLRDHKFYDKVKDAALFKTVDGEYLTLKEYLGDSEEKKVYYTNDTTQQAIYVNMFKAENIKIVVLDKLLDNQFISMLEQEDKDLKFLRIDANTDAIKKDDAVQENEKLKNLFCEISGNEKLTVSFTPLKDTKIPAVLNISEETRRLNDMMKMYSMYSQKDTGMSLMNEESTLVLNTDNPLINKLEELCSDEPTDNAKAIAKQIYTLALIGQRQLTADELSEFLTNSFDILEKL